MDVLESIHPHTYIFLFICNIHIYLIQIQWSVHNIWKMLPMKHILILMRRYCHVSISWDVSWTWKQTKCWINRAEKEIYLMYVIVVFPVNMCPDLLDIWNIKHRERNMNPHCTLKKHTHTRTHLYVYHSWLCVLPYLHLQVVDMMCYKINSYCYCVYHVY